MTAGRELGEDEEKEACGMKWVGGKAKAIPRVAGFVLMAASVWCGVCLFQVLTVKEDYMVS